MPPLGYVDIDVVLNDTDVDNPNSDLVVAAGTILNVRGGTAVLQGDNRTVRFTPAANANDGNTPGGFGFTYRVSDGVLTSLNVGTVTISVTAVNDTPTAVDDVGTVREDTTLNVPAPGVLTNDLGIGDTPLTLMVVGGPTDGGLLTLDPDGSYSYTPSGDFFGVSTFRYRVTDLDGEWSEAVVAITVTAVNDTPVAVDDGTVGVPLGTAEDTPLTVVVLANDSGLGDTPLGVTATNGANGTVVVNPGNTVTYTPVGNWNGDDSFTYTVTDLDGEWDTATVYVRVTAVNDRPVAANDNRTVLEDVPPLGYVDIDVVLNDTDVDNPNSDLVVAAGTILNVRGGTAVLQGDNRTVRFTPAADANDGNTPGGFGFTYQVNDGALTSLNVGTVTVAVTAVNDTPVAVDDGTVGVPLGTAEDTPLTVVVLANDSGLGDTPLGVTATNGANGTVVVNPGNTVRYTPAGNWYGDDSFTYTVTDLDGEWDTATVYVRVTAVNDRPVAVDDTPAAILEDSFIDIEVVANDTDVDNPNSDLMVAAGTILNVRGGTAVLQGDNRTVRFTPAADANDGNTPGGFGFTYQVNDGALTSLNVGTVTVAVTAVNDAPVANPDGYTADEDTPLVVAAPGVLGNDVDIDSPALTAAWVSGPTNGSLTLNTDGSFTYTPNRDFYGIDTFIYRAFDGSLYSAPATVTMTIHPVPPVLIVESAASQPTVNVGESFTFTIIWANLGPDDAPGATLDQSLAGPCTRLSPAFPMALGTIAEGEGGFVDVTVRADGPGTCTSTATLTSTRSNPSPSSASVDIVEPSPFTGFVSNVLSFLGLSSEDPGTPTAMPADPGLLASESPPPTPAEPTAGPGPEEPAPPEGSPTSEGPPPDPATLEATPEPPTEPIAPLETPMEPTAPPEPLTEPIATVEPPAEPTATPLVVAQGGLMADSRNPLGWVVLALTGVWLGRRLVFRVRLPHAAHPHKGTRYHEPATRPHR